MRKLLCCTVMFLFTAGCGDGNKPQVDSQVNSPANDAPQPGSPAPIANTPQPVSPAPGANVPQPGSPAPTVNIPNTPTAADPVQEVTPLAASALKLFREKKYQEFASQFLFHADQPRTEGFLMDVQDDLIEEAYVAMLSIMESGKPTVVQGEFLYVVYSAPEVEIVGRKKPVSVAWIKQGDDWKIASFGMGTFDAKEQDESIHNPPPPRKREQPVSNARDKEKFGPVNGKDKTTDKR